MREATFDGTAAGWRDAARLMLAAGREPGGVAWRVSDDVQEALPLFDAAHADGGSGPARPAHGPPARVPRRFVQLVERVSCHRDPERWHRLYVALWRLTHGEPHLLDVHTDPDVRALATMAKAVDREVHKMHAFVRFRAVDVDGAEAYVAWFEPGHPVLSLAAPLFARRFASMRWAILTPDACVVWDGGRLVTGPGVSRDEVPADGAESLWRTYYAHVFNPARANARAMRREMPRRYWRNLPEAALIPRLLADAPAQVRGMVERQRAGRGDDSGDQAIGHPAASDAGTPPPLALGGCAVRVGTAGWTDPTLLRAGLFYPGGVSTPEKRLRYYASRFPLVEVDASYYAIPTARTAALWAARTPDGFVFDVKAHAAMTGHPVDVPRLPAALRDRLPPSLRASARVPAGEMPTALEDEVWRVFLDALAPLCAAGRMGSLLVQFPRWFTPSTAAADRLRAIRERLSGWYAAGHVAAVELRHRDWYAPRLRSRTLRLLERLELVHVAVDAPAGHASSVPLVPVATHPGLAILRLHGRRTETWERPVSVVSERYRYLYDTAELEALAAPVVELSRQSRRVHVVFNNCHADYGTRNADEIAGILRRCDVSRRPSGAATG